VGKRNASAKTRPAASMTESRKGAAIGLCNDFDPFQLQGGSEQFSPFEDTFALAGAILECFMSTESRIRNCA
jgi:hypothetical protein